MAGWDGHTGTFHNPTHNQNAQPSVLHVISAVAYPYILALVRSAKQKQGDGALTSFIYPSFLLSFHFLFQFSFQLISSSLTVLFCPLLPSHSLAALIYYYNPPSSPFSLSVHVLSHFLPPPLSSPFNFSRSPLCSPLTPSSERPIRLHRGFTGWGCEGKPKWNAAHLLEWNQDGFSSITPYAPPGLLLLQLHCTKKPQNTSSKHVWLCVCLRASHYLHNTVCECVCVHLIVYTT